MDVKLVKGIGYKSSELKNSNNDKFCVSSLK